MPKKTKQDELQSKLAKILGTRKSFVEIRGIVEEDDTAVIQCRVGISSYMVVLKDQWEAQVYRRVQ